MFYHGAELVRAGQVAQLHDLHPAFEELLFVPLTYLGYFPAYWVWTLLNVFMMALSLGMLRKTFPEVGRFGPVLLILSVSAFAPGCQGPDSGTGFDSASAAGYPQPVFAGEEPRCLGRCGAWSRDVQVPFGASAGARAGGTTAAFVAGSLPGDGDSFGNLDDDGGAAWHG